MYKRPKEMNEWRRGFETTVIGRWAERTAMKATGHCDASSSQEISEDHELKRFKVNIEGPSEVNHACTNCRRKWTNERTEARF